MSRSPFADRPLLSAEVHYFRVPRDAWELQLTRARQLGANTISTYVPWVWHAPQPEAIDLTGSSHPQRDVTAFVALCGALGLQIILKPGPFIDAETLGGGVPPWLLQQHPEAWALRPDGTPWRHSDSGLPRACYLHPVYQAAARSWIAAFSQALRQYQHPAGPVVALQADNETPGDGMLPADAGLDPRFKLDYNQHVVSELWPHWATRAGLVAVPELPRSWEVPADHAQLQLYAQLDVFTDWYYATAVAHVVSWLRDEGWQVPIYHDLLAAPWEACGTIADMPGLARATGWLGQNVYAEEVRDAFVGGAGYCLSFEEYVHYAYWRTRLVKHLSRGLPAFVPEISAAQDFYFAAPFIGGLEAINVYVAPQTPVDNPGVGAFVRWAMEAPVRPDGEVRQRFWNAKTWLTLLGAAGADVAGARAPADVAVGYSHVPERVGNWGYRFDYLRQGREPLPGLEALTAGCDHATRSQLLAQRLVRASVAFDVLDLDAATPEELARYRLVVVPAAAVLARTTQAKLADLANLALVGATPTRFDERLEPCALLTAAEQLAEDVSGIRVGELVEERGGTARYAWADTDGVDVTVRYGATFTYLFVANRRPTPYNGTLAYRSPGGEVQHVHLGLPGLRAGAMMLQDGEIVGAVCGGDGSGGGWLARAAHSSVVYNSGAGMVAPCDGGLIMTAPQSGRFQLRHPSGWVAMRAWRLLLSGRLLPATFQVESLHASVSYVAEDEFGQTDLYLLLRDDAALAPYLREYLATLLRARAAALRRAALAHLSQHEAAAALQALEAAAEELERCASALATLDAYDAAWQQADQALAQAGAQMIRALTSARGALLAGTLAPDLYESYEHSLSGVLNILAHWSQEA